MRTLRKRVVVAIIVAIAALSTACLVVGVSSLRSAVATIALRIVLRERGGFDLRRGTLSISRTRVQITSVEIDDASGKPLLTADRIDASVDPATWLGRSTRAYGLESLVIERPSFHLIRLADGSYNTSSLLGTPAPNAGPTKHLPLRFLLAVHNGTFEFGDPAAPARPGRRFEVESISANGRIDEGAVTTIHASGRYRGGGTVAPVSFDVLEDDAARFARATLRSHGLALAPIVDGIAPTPSFAVEAGVLQTLQLNAYSIDYDPATGPAWMLSGTGYLTGGRIRVRPLIESVSGISGPLSLAGGNLSTQGLNGSLAGKPLAIHGGVRLIGGLRLALSMSGRESLSDLRHAFSFSNLIDIRGGADAAVRIDGPPADVDVAVTYRALGSISYRSVPLDGVRGLLYYHGGHVTLPVANATYNGGSIVADGDIDVGANVPSARFDVAATMPAGDLPIAVNVNPTGEARSLAEVDGTLVTLSGSGYVEIIRGNGAIARTAFYAGPDRFAVGPMLIHAAGGGSIMMRGGIVRAVPRRSIDGELVASNAPLHLVAAARSLPGIATEPLALPNVDGTMSGTVLVRGDEGAPGVFINAHTRDLVVAGARLGRVGIEATGTAGRVIISHLSIDGGDASFTASGTAKVLPRSGTYAAALVGDGSANLAALASAMPWSAMKGNAVGSFSAALAGGRWTVAMRAAGRDASIAGMRVNTMDATVGGGGGGTTDVYAGSMAFAGGSVSGMGVVGGRSRTGADLRMWTDGFDLATLPQFGARVQRGRAVAVAGLRGSFSDPVISAAAAVSGADFGGQPISGDVDVRYAGQRLVVGDGRVAVGGGLAIVNGSVSGLGPGNPAGDARLAMNATMREGDLGSLAGRYLPRTVHLAGTVAASLRVSGTLSAPRIDGIVNADSGTLQGVAFERLDSEVHASSDAVLISGGSFGIESSHFAFSGSVSRAALHVRASSPSVNLADFNNFFEGYDTLEGVGSGNVAFETTRTGVAASGHVSVSRASIGGFPLGRVNLDFGSLRDQLLAKMRQSGDAGSANLSGRVTFAPRRYALPNFRTARYDVRGNVRGVDVGRITPLIGRESIGLTGLLDVDGVLRGTLNAPTGRADFHLRDAHVGKVEITQARGSIKTDGSAVSIRNAGFTLPFASVEGEGSIGPGKRIAASARVDASDLGTLFALLGRPGIASGTALATVTVSGTTKAPRIATAILSGRGSAFGVSFDRISGKANYGPGEIDIADTEVSLSGGRGVFAIGGTLPLQLRPFGFGPKEKSVNLTVAARAVDLSALDPLMSKYATLTGRLDAKGQVTGSAGRPQLAGSAQLRGASVSSPFETVAADHINADLALARDTLSLQRLSGNLGRGTIAGSGAVHIVPALGLLSVAGLQYWTKLDVRGAQIDVPGWVSGSVSGSLRLTKSGPTPFLSGNATLDEGTVPFSAIYQLASGYGSGPPPVSGSIPGVPPLLPGHIVVYGGGVFGGGGPFVLNASPGVAAGPAHAVLPNVDLNVTAGAGRNVRVHGGAIDLTATGGVVIGGNLQSLTLTGSFTSTRGQIGYFDTNFRLLRGAVTFDPVEGLLPTLDVKAVTNLSGAEITLTVTGRVDNLQTDLSANPTMTRDEIVATLLHAPQVQSVFSANPTQAQSQLYAEAQTYFNAQLSRSLLFPVESLVAQTLNVEQISLIYDAQGRVNVEVRKLITPTVYAIYRSSLSVPVTQTAGVAYSLRDYADLEILQTQSPTGFQQSVLNLRLTFH